MEFINSFIQKLNFGPEVLIGVLIIVFFLVWSLSLGRSKIAISLLAIYIAFSVTVIFPFWSLIDIKLDVYLVEISVFLAIYIITLIIFSASFLKKRLASNEFSFLSIMLISFLQIGFLLSILISFMPSELGIKYLGQFYKYFGSSEALFVWSVLPLPGILFLKR